jgi:hypothetical protein
VLLRAFCRTLRSCPVTTHAKEVCVPAGSFCVHQCVCTHLKLLGWASGGTWHLQPVTAATWCHEQTVFVFYSHFIGSNSLHGCMMIISGSTLFILPAQAFCNIGVCVCTGLIQRYL